MQKKFSKRAALVSIVVVILCCALLIGNTFAWFTDSVSSGRNVIKSGELDISLLHKAVSADDFVAVTEDTTDLFYNVAGEPILWEPGVRGFETFRIRNDGDLALQYKFTVKAYNATVTEDGRNLTEVLTASHGNEIGKILGEGYSIEGVLLPDEHKDYDISLIWHPGNNDNAYNVEDGLSLDLCIELVATQYTYEKDAFDDQYDAGASLDGLKAESNYTLEEDSTDPFDVENGQVYNIDLGGYTLSADYPVDNKGDLNIFNGTIEANTTGLRNQGNATVTDITMNAGSPSDYASVSYAGSNTTFDNVDVNTKGGGIVATDGAKVTFDSGSVEINSTQTSARYVFFAAGEGSELTVNDGTFRFDTLRKRAYVYAANGAVVTINGGNFGVAPNHPTWANNPIITDATGKVIIKGGTFGFDPTTWVAAGYEAVKTGSTWTVSPIATP